MGNRTDLSYRFPLRYRVVWFALAAMVLISLVLAPEVFGRQSLLFVTALAGVLAIAAVGQGLVVITGGIDLSVPSVMTLGGIVLVKVAGQSDGELAGALALAFGLALVIGLVNGLLVAVARMNALIVTLAMNGIVGGATIWWAGSTFSATGSVPPALLDLSSRSLGPIALIGLIGLAVAIMSAAFLRSTTLGRSFVATGASHQAARIVGIRVRAHEASGYAVASVLYMTAGVLLAALLHTPDFTLGFPYQLTTIVAIALGGAALGGGPSSLICIAGAALFLPLLDQFLEVKDLSAGVEQVVSGAILVAAVGLVTLGSRRRSLRRSGVVAEPALEDENGGRT